ncbi:uncharacterized protein [Lolium perenne]|uniref:uncharacterized protein n=1 Tax=Lolium perenne TaxID=4522 RepID=UPI003A9A0852
MLQSGSAHSTTDAAPFRLRWLPSMVQPDLLLARDVSKAGEWSFKPGSGKVCLVRTDQDNVQVPIPVVVLLSTGAPDCAASVRVPEPVYLIIHVMSIDCSLNKTVNAFQRVELDDVKLADVRLQDNQVVSAPRNPPKSDSRLSPSCTNRASFNWRIRYCRWTWRVRKLAEPRRIRLGSWNVGSLTGKLPELVDTAVRRRVDVLCVQETKWKGQKAKEVEDTGFKLWYTGTTSNKYGVGILVNKSLSDGVVDVKRQGDRMILVKLVVGDLVLNVISAYAPQVGHNESTKREFWEGLEDLVRRVPIGEKLFIGGDLNGHVGTSNTGFEMVHRGFGYGIRNQEGEDVLSFALAYDMVVANTLFRKRESHLVTFSSGLHSSQIDFVLSRREDRRACIDCKVIPGESVVPQHKLVVADFRFRIRVQRGKRAKVARTKWWKLKGEASQSFRERVIKEGPWEEGGDANMMWTSMATCLRKVAVEEFGVTKGSRREAKDTWWWNDEVQKVIREKKDYFRCLYLDRSAANMEKYKVAKKAAKRAVSEARGRAYEDLYQRLNTKEGERDIYKMAKFRERKTRDVDEVKCIKDGDDQLLVKDEAIKRRWREYFDNLYNGEAESSTIELDDSFDDTSMCFVRRIQESEVKEALRRMKGGKAMGPDGSPQPSACSPSEL